MGGGLAFRDLRWMGLEAGVQDLGLGVIFGLLTRIPESLWKKHRALSCEV